MESLKPIGGEKISRGQARKMIMRFENVSFPFSGNRSHDRTEGKQVNSLFFRPPHMHIMYYFIREECAKSGNPRARNKKSNTKTRIFPETLARNSPIVCVVQ